MQCELGDLDARVDGILHEQITVIAVGAEHQRTAVGDQPALATEVVFEGGVFDVADVVGGDVEEDSHVEGQAVDAVDLVGLGGDLHHQVSHAVIRGLAHHAERVQRLRRGQLRRQHGMTVKAEVHRREQRATAMRIFVQDGMRQIGGGGLAFGAGDADDREFVLGHAVEGGGQQAQGLARVVDDESRNLGVIGEVTFRHIGDETALLESVKEFRPEAALAHQQRAFAHGAGVIGDMRERHIGIVDAIGIQAPTFRCDDLIEQMMGGQQMHAVGKGQ